MKPIAKNYLLNILAYSALLFSSCTNEPIKTSESTNADNKISEKEYIQKGEHLVQIMGCNDCHSPKQMGPKGPEIIADLMLSGYPSERPIVTFDNKILSTGFPIFYPDLTAAAGPWGVSFAGNLTPDESGIGNWTFEQFKKALTQGKYKGLDGSRMLLPPMPWTNFTNLSDEEVRSIYLYLKQIKPVKNNVPEAIPPSKSS